jgi:hypothetical protein
MQSSRNPSYRAAEEKIVWFDEREENELVSHFIRDDILGNNRQAINLKLLRKSSYDLDLWPVYGFVFVRGISGSLVRLIAGFPIWHYEIPGR